MCLLACSHRRGPPVACYVERPVFVRLNGRSGWRIQPVDATASWNRRHFFVANEIKRFSVGTKNKDLKLGNDGALTIYVQSDKPTDAGQLANWLSAPKGDFSLYVRTYWPKAEATDGQWTPPAVIKV